MIRYTLSCDKDHVFDGWFRDSGAYDTQVKRGFVACPTCGSAKVSKTIMAPSLSRSAPAPALVSTMPIAESPQPVALVSEKEREMRSMLRAVRAFVEANSEDVGRRFVEEARKMHEGEIEHRAIRGEAAGDDVKALIEDGIEIFPLPLLPDERN